MKSATDNLRYKLIRQRYLWAGITFAAVARRLGVSRSMVTRVAKGERKSARVQRALARAMGTRTAELWHDDTSAKRGKRTAAKAGGPGTVA